MTYHDALAALDALYAQLPTVPCQQRCAQSCGLIVMTKLEWVRILRKVGYTPKGKADCVCPLLKHNLCSVHAIRPTICRLYGALLDQKMLCPFGCTPDRVLTSDESDAFLAAVQAVSDTIYPHTPPAVYTHGLSLDVVGPFIDAARAKGAL